MLKAASLIYAIFIALLIGILCYSIVLMFSVQLNIDNHFDTKQDLLNNNRSAVEYFKAHYQEMDAKTSVTIFPQANNIETSFEISPWGLFKKVKISSFIKKDSISQIFLTGERHISSSPAIYLRDNDTELKISGKTEIQGDLYISDYGLKKTTITGNSGFYEPIFHGNIFKSEKVLPPVAKYEIKQPEYSELLLLEDIHESFVINAFDKKTKIIEANGILENIELKGNIILRSQDTLTIMPSAHMEDIIIEAPKVIFTAGTQGSAQVFSTHEILVGENVKLFYPSILVVNSNDFPTGRKNVTIGKNSIVEGAILLYGDGIVDEEKNKIILEIDSMVTGDIYCDGMCSIYGKIRGSVFTSSFLHKTEITEYKNLIFNGTVLSTEVPDFFFQVPLMDRFKSMEPLIIKKV
ncbi:MULTISPECIES: hypothetical protein [Aequorivita]|uniref:Polymer-forming cytoskeletal protein n=1 Tax=Aequorivita iocasae TaxID=2803865 RepID=A0ABX7DSA7_9FLAO|nr:MULTISPECIES: hypothetical protein [Aequorivita]QQX76501.1 hypothetical protein JK629_14430 [Aequorivita iocasae]UCA55974.1 hypothetical protein LDL78_14500 [Aequorivita sp. F7]